MAANLRKGKGFSQTLASALWRRYTSSMTDNLVKEIIGRRYAVEDLRQFSDRINDPCGRSLPGLQLGGISSVGNLALQLSPSPNDFHGLGSRWSQDVFASTYSGLKRNLSAE
ncbi:hypothetical protein HCH54_008477 [Aspergillus fumigatus]